MKSCAHLLRRRFRASKAFTRVDLLSGAAALLLLATLSLPALGTNLSTGRSTLCLNNMRTLIRAWQMYADDNAGKLVHNYHGGDARGGAAANRPGTAPWASGWFDWATSADNTNRSLILDPVYARLATYLPENTSAHKCPEDNFLGGAQKALGWMERVRSVVMNGTIGEGNAVTGPWFPIYRQIKSMDDFRFPAPSDAIVFQEEHPDSLNDPYFFAPDRTRWIDLPGNLHENGMTAAFADGHTELHPWQSSIRNKPVRYSSFSTLSAPIGDADISWLSYHSSRRSEDHF